MPQTDDKIQVALKFETLSEACKHRMFQPYLEDSRTTLVPQCAENWWKPCKLDLCPLQLGIVG